MRRQPFVRLWCWRKTLTTSLSFRIDENSSTSIHERFGYPFFTQTLAESHHYTLTRTVHHRLFVLEIYKGKHDSWKTVQSRPEHTHVLRARHG